MQVRGSIISSIKAFVETKHPKFYNEWLNTLSADSRQLMDRPGTSEWYPLEPGILEPTKKTCELFYSNDLSGAWESGRFSAEVSLTGIYKIFVLISSPGFLIKRASRIIATFYAPTEVAVVKSSDKFMIIHFTELPTRSKYLESRIAGWMEKALEICGCMSLSVKITKSIANGDDIFEVNISWK